MSDEQLVEELRSAFDARSAAIEDRPELLHHLLEQAPRQRSRRSAAPLLAAAAAIAVIAAGVVVQRNLATTGTDATAGSSRVVGTPTDRRFPPSGLPSYFVANQIVSTNPWRTSPAIVDATSLTAAFRLPVALRYAHLSPEGTRVYGIYAGPTASKASAGDMRVGYYDLSTGRLVEIARAGWITAAALSGDGHTLAYAQIQHTPAGDITRVEVRNLSSGKRSVFEVPHGNGTLAMALSPDGGTVAFTQTQTKNMLFVIDVAPNTPGRGITPVVPPATCKNGGYDYPVWNSAGLFALQECDGPRKSSLQTTTVVGLNPQTLQPQVTAAKLPAGGALAMTVVPVGTDSLDVLFVPAADDRGGTAPLANNALRVIAAKTDNRPTMIRFAATTP